MTLPAELIQYLDSHTRCVEGPGLDTLRDHLLERHGDTVEAIVFYGSCLRTGDPFEGLVDLYLIAKDYGEYYPHRLPAIFNKLLPPNVYYLELKADGRTVRAKYAVVSMADFTRGTSAWFHSYLWGRFTQPVAFLYLRDDNARRSAIEALAHAALRFLDHALPQTGNTFSIQSLWSRGLRLSYGAELRAEPPERALELFQTHAEHYRKITLAALPALAFKVNSSPETQTLSVEIPDWMRRQNAAGWVARRFQGKILSLLRLIKALFTFHGGIDYILWKIERHSGVTVEVSPFARRYPLLGGWGVFWRLYRRGAFR